MEQRGRKVTESLLSIPSWFKSGLSSGSNGGRRSSLTASSSSTMADSEKSIISRRRMTITAEERVNPSIAVLHISGCTKVVKLSTLRLIMIVFNLVIFCGSALSFLAWLDAKFSFKRMTVGASEISDSGVLAVSLVDLGPHVDFNNRPLESALHEHLEKVLVMTSANLLLYWIIYGVVISCRFGDPCGICTLVMSLPHTLFMMMWEVCLSVGFMRIERALSELETSDQLNEVKNNFELRSVIIFYRMWSPVLASIYIMCCPVQLAMSLLPFLIYYLPFQGSQGFFHNYMKSGAARVGGKSASTGRPSEDPSQTGNGNILSEIGGLFSAFSRGTTKESSQPPAPGGADSVARRQRQLTEQTEDESVYGRLEPFKDPANVDQEILRLYQCEMPLEKIARIKFQLSGRVRRVSCNVEHSYGYSGMSTGKMVIQSLGRFYHPSQAEVANNAQLFNDNPFESYLCKPHPRLAALDSLAGGIKLYPTADYMDMHLPPAAQVIATAVHGCREEAEVDRPLKQATEKSTQTQIDIRVTDIEPKDEREDEYVCQSDAEVVCSVVGSIVDEEDPDEDDEAVADVGDALENKEEKEEALRKDETYPPICLVTKEDDTYIPNCFITRDAASTWKSKHPDHVFNNLGHNWDGHIYEEVVASTGEGNLGLKAASERSSPHAWEKFPNLNFGEEEAVTRMQAAASSKTGEPEMRRPQPSLDCRRIALAPDLPYYRPFSLSDAADVIKLRPASIQPQDSQRSQPAQGRSRSVGNQDRKLPLSIQLPFNARSPAAEPEAKATGMDSWEARFKRMSSSPRTSMSGSAEQDNYQLLSACNRLGLPDPPSTIERSRSVGGAYRERPNSAASGHVKTAIKMAVPSEVIMQVRPLSVKQDDLLARFEQAQRTAAIHPPTVGRSLSMGCSTSCRPPRPPLAPPATSSSTESDWRGRLNLDDLPRNYDDHMDLSLIMGPNYASATETLSTHDDLALGGARSASAPMSSHSYFV